ncbi:Phasin (PHA-granule associated protein) [Paraburkholderia hospita]|uniref:Phasin (PHA-granule associated protein) n=1 Tax=Paraburkholderia hospita TaxID=169430 RepID=A0AAN1MQU7_9BURK|nr:phasin family protein [Paraburkholderia hospita]AUT76148.1 Phasin (PHA-granule associated protein) [Paraburkholderia hospita]
MHAELSDLKKQLHTPVSPEQVAAAQKVNLDTFCGLTNKIVEGVEKLAELNLQVIKTTLAEAQDSAGKALSARDPREWFALQLSFTAPIAEKMHAYGRHLFDISSATQAEFARVAQAQHEVHNRWVQTLVEDLAKSAPVGSEAAIAAWQSVINTTNTLYETLQKTGQEAVTVAERDFDDATSAASTAVRRTIDQASGA